MLESEDSPLPTGPLTVQQKSWVSALMYLGGSLGCLFFGWASNRYGRKYPMMAAAVPQLVNKKLKIFTKYFLFLVFTCLYHFLKQTCAYNAEHCSNIALSALVD